MVAGVLLLFGDKKEDMPILRLSIYRTVPRAVCAVCKCLTCNEVMVGQKIVLPQACLSHSA